MSLLGGTTSSSMLYRDSETECLCDDLDDGTFDDDDFFKMKLAAFFNMVAAQTHKEMHWGFLAGGKTHNRSIWSVKNCNEFLGIF